MSNWSACSVCGVVVANEHQDRHTAWHDDIGKILLWAVPENGSQK
jgi:hypothetical protein